MVSYNQWWRQEFPDAGANVLERRINPEGLEPRLLYNSLFEGRKHNFRNNNLNNWLETIYFLDLLRKNFLFLLLDLTWREESMIYLG